MKRYPSLNYPGEVTGLGAGDTVYAQEKLDGANFRFMLRDRLDGKHEPEKDLVFGSRNVVWKNEDDVANAFRDHPETGVGALEFVRDNIDLEAFRLIDNEHDGIVVYGEAMHPHTLDYNWSDTPRVAIYDIWMQNHESYVHPSGLKAKCRSLGLPWAPYVDQVPAERYGDIDIPQSAYRDGKAEGIVLKNPDTGHRAKIVTEEFKEKHDGPLPSQSNLTDTDAVVDSVITDARIEKQAHKLVDAGEWGGLQMQMMEDLPEAVIRDAMAEEAGSIVMENNYELDTAELRSKASSKCARVLRGLLQ